jgi:hypothetical protein
LTTIFNDLRESGVAAEQLLALAGKSDNPDFLVWAKLFNAMRQKYRRQAPGLPVNCWCLQRSYSKIRRYGSR